MKNRLIITVDQAYENRMTQIVNALNERGNEIVEIYPFGVLMVYGEAFEIEELKKIEGIEEVTTEGNFHLPSPKSDLQ